MKFSATVFFFLLAGLRCFSQDVHLTQFYTSNLSLNPAFTGNYNGDIRLVANYRNQWKQVTAPIQTNMFSFEKKVVLHKDEFGLGVIVMNDRLNTYSLNTNKIFLGASFQKNLNGHFFRAGLQGGIVQRKTDYSNQTFPVQWNKSEGSFDMNKSSGETALTNQALYPSFNAGIGWIKKYKSIKLTAGYGIFNINRPKDGFISTTDRLAFRHSGNVHASIYLSHQYTIMPQILYMRSAGATDFVFVTNAGKKITQEVSVLLGAGYRGSQTNSDAFLAIVGLSYRRFDFGFSMDFNVSQLSVQSKGKTAYEISLIYTTPSLFSNKASIPCDRY